MENLCNECKKKKVEIRILNKKITEMLKQLQLVYNLLTNNKSK